MKQLISNSLNQKSVINNIRSGSLNKVILLTGSYGVGKTEFATQIARMITCRNLTDDGFCGECESCQKEISTGLNNFNAEITLLNMRMIDYEQMVTIVAQAVKKVRSRDEAFILDEFHLVDKKVQELWLAETAKLEDCYIIMATTDRKSVSEGIISRSIQIGMKQLAPLEAKQLIKQYYPEATEKTIQALVKKIGGVPRELISMATYYANAGLDQDEIIHHLSNVNQQEILLCLEALGERELFFDTLRTVRTMSEYTVRKALQDILWDWLGATEAERKTMTALAKFDEKQIMRFLRMSSEDPFLTILNMFSSVTIRPPLAEDMETLKRHEGHIDKQPIEKFKKAERWDG